MPREDRRTTSARSVTRTAGDFADAPELSGSEFFDVGLAIANKLALTIDLAIDLVATCICIERADRSLLAEWMRESLQEDAAHGRHGDLFVARDRASTMARAERTLQRLLELEATLADAQFIEVLRSQHPLEVTSGEMRAQLSGRMTRHLVQGGRR